MTRSAVAVVGVLALLGPTAAACGDDADDTDPSSVGTPSAVVSSDTSPAPSELCTALLSDDVLGVLGWPDPQPAGERAGRCGRSAEAGTITVGLRQDLVADGDHARAQRAFDRACVGLGREGSPSPDTDTDWLGPDTTACFRPFPTGKDMGFAEMFVLTDDDAIVEIQVAAGRPTSEPQVLAALETLVTQVEDEW